MFDLSGALEDNVVRIMTILAILSGARRTPMKLLKNFLSKLDNGISPQAFCKLKTVFPLH